jgi:peptidylprolyl isomerase
MLTFFTVRAFLLVAALVVVGVAAMPAGAGDDKKKDPPKIPPLDSKDWKAVGDKGLKAWDATEGKGDAVKPGAMVTIHCWQEGIPGMKEGGKRRLMIPSDLGYGDEGSPPDIPGKATLVFEIEMIRNWSLPAPDAKEWREVKDTGGLKTWDVKEGKGEAIKAGDEVTIHYTGWTLDGKIFDSSQSVASRQRSRSATSSRAGSSACRA